MIQSSLNDCQMFVQLSLLQILGTFNIEAMYNLQGHI